MSDNNTTKYKIDTNIPYHNFTSPRGSEYKYPFHLMKTGDSFRSKTGKDEHARVRQAMSARKRNHTNESWVSSKETVGKHTFVRVWRVK